MAMLRALDVDVHCFWNLMSLSSSSKSSWSWKSVSRMSRWALLLKEITPTLDSSGERGIFSTIRETKVKVISHPCSLTLPEESNRKIRSMLSQSTSENRNGKDNIRVILISDLGCTCQA